VLGSSGALAPRFLLWFPVKIVTLSAPARGAYCGALVLVPAKPVRGLHALINLGAALESALFCTGEALRGSLVEPLFGCMQGLGQRSSLALVLDVVLGYVRNEVGLVTK